MRRIMWSIEDLIMDQDEPKKEESNQGEGEPASDDGKVSSAKASLYDPESLQRLLVDCITFKSTIDDIDVVIQCGAKIDQSVKRGLKPIHYAVYVDYVACVEYLVEKGANINATDDIGYTAVHLCARKGNLESLRSLIKHGALIDSFTDSPEMDNNSRLLGYLTVEPLNLALENNHLECVRLLLDKGARPDHLYFMGYEINLVPLEHLDCLEVLLQYGADPNVFNRCGISPLMKACRQQNIEACRVLLEYGAKLDSQCPDTFDRKTALHFAIEKGNIGIVHMLMRNGALPTRPTDYKYSALHTAVMSDRPDICEMLFRWKASVDELTDENCTALMLACATADLKHQQEIIKLLLDRGANTNCHANLISYTSPYLSPLSEYLRSMGELVTYDVVQMLLKHGSRVHFKGSNSVARLRDPFGILHYLPNDKVENRTTLFEILASAACSFDITAIKYYSRLDARERSMLMDSASTPLSLRQQSRLYIRHQMCNMLPSKVNSLPLPSVIKNYLLFEG